MSGLFDSLTARFATDSQPAIRPRPLSRFEDGAQGRGGDGPQEQESERIAPASRPAPVPGRHQQPRPGPVVPDTPATRLERNSDTSPAQPAPELAPLPRDDAPADTPTQPLRARRRVLIPTENQAQQRSPPAAQVSGQVKHQPQPSAATRLSSPPAEPPAIAGTITERIIKTRRDADEPPAVPRPGPEPRRSEAARVEAPATALDSPVIRIGRIEVTRPAPPVAPPAPAQAARPQAPRHAAAAPRGRQASGLTDYLGWKKK